MSPTPSGRRTKRERYRRPTRSGAASPSPRPISNADWVAERATFDLLPEQLVPPRARVPTGLSPSEHLERRCYEALLQRYQGDRLAHARRKLEEQLATIRAVGLTDFFLVAAEVTDHCRRRGILAAGHGSAAADICCYRLGITLLDLLTRTAPRRTRHLTPHSGGVLLARDPLTHYSPLQRSSGGIELLQVDKDDAEALGLIKLALLGLRMLAALERARDEVLRTQAQ